MAFALALTPALMEFVALVFFWVGTGRFFRNRELAAAGQRALRPVWPLFLFGMFAFALSLWQLGHVIMQYGSFQPNYDYETDSISKFGVAIPIEVGDKVNDFVHSASSLLINVAVLGAFVWVLFLPRGRLKSKYPVWIFRLIMLGVIAFIIWNSRLSVRYDIENLRALF